MKTYKLSTHCRYVKGSCGAAIYDLKNNKVYRLNADAVTIVDKAFEGIRLENSKEFLDSLESSELLNCFEHVEFSEPCRVDEEIVYVWLEVTSRCNCACLHCYGNFGHVSDGFDDELSFDEWKNILIQVKQIGGNAIQFIGGDPLLHPHFTELLLFAHEIGIENIDIFTNGHLIDEEMAKIIQKVKASVRVSLYGYNSETHDAITQCKGSFHSLNRCLEILKSCDIKTKIAVILMRENQDWLEEIIEYINKVGHQYTGYDTVRKVTHCSQNCHAVTNSDILKKRFIEKPRFFTSYRSFYSNASWNSCWFGKLAISSKGDVFPCIFARDLVCGNIKRDSFDEIKSNLLSYWKITKDNVEICKDCEYRYACADCRPLSMGETGSIHGKYPRCCYDPHRCEWNLI